MSAQADDDIYNLSLEELMNTPVNIASKRNENIKNASGIITVITAAELTKYGARNLHDAMRLIPGVQQIYPQITHRNSVAIRGQVAGALDKYFLILLNGQPLRDPMLYGINAPVYEGIPLEAIERLEIIRGPGSVMYGSNAFSGVMDIITKDPNALPDNSIKISAGSFSSQINEAFVNTKIFDEGSLVGSIRTSNSDGWELAFTDTGGNNSAFKNKNTSWGGFIEVNYGGFTANIFQAEVKEVATLSNGLISHATERPSDRNFYSLVYEYDATEQWHLQTDFTMNTSDFAGSTEYDATDMVFEITAQGQYQQIAIDLGLNLHRNTLIDTSNITVSEVDYKSVYAQLSTPLTDSMQVITGIQVIDPQVSEIQYSPRISLINTWSETLHSKLMYSQAYSSPTGIEFSLDLPGLFSGNRNLVPTTIDTYDFQLTYQQSKIMLAMSLFYSEIDNSIVLESVIPGQPLPKQFTNVDLEKHHGMELESRWDISQTMQFIGSYSYQTSTDSQGIKDNKLLSNHMLKTGLLYQPDNTITVSLFNVYHSKPSNRDPLINKFNPEEKAYSHLTLNMKYHTSFSSRYLNKLVFDIYIDNALNNSAIYLPDPTLTNLNTMPKVSERSYYAGVTLSF